MQHRAPHHKPFIMATGEEVVVVAVGQQVAAVAGEVVVAVPRVEEEEEEALHQQLDPLDRFKEEVITLVTA